MITYTIKRKTYSEEDQGSSRMSKGGKIAAGIGTAAATAGLAFAGARRGMLGTGLQRTTNVAWGKMGHKFGSNKMMESAAKGMGKAAQKKSKDSLMTQNKKAVKAGKAAKYTDQKIETISSNAGKKIEQGALQSFQNGNKIRLFKL